MEITKPEPESPSKTDLKPPDTEPDTVADTSPDTPIDTDTDTEHGLSVSKVNQAICLKLQGHSYRDIAEKTGMSFATVSRILKGVSLENGAVAKDGSPVPQEDKSHSEPVSPLAEAVKPEQPQNYFLKPGLTAQEWAELSKKDKASLLSMVGELRAQNSSLQATAVMGKGNGGTAIHHNGDSSSTDSESAFWNELAKTERIERALRIRDRYSTDKGGSVPSDVKGILEIFKIFAPKQVDELQIYKAASEDTRKNLETVMKKNETNSFDIQLENLRQSKEIDMERLKWEQEKWRDGKEDDVRKWDQIGKVFSGPIGDVVKNLGSAGAERVRGKRQPKIAQISCPSCNGSIFIDENSDSVVCGKCGSYLARQQPEKQQPSQTPEENKSMKTEEETNEEEVSKI